MFADTSVDCEFIWSLNSVALLLVVIAFEYVPTGIPMSLSGLPITFVRTILDCVLVICNCLPEVPFVTVTPVTPDSA